MGGMAWQRVGDSGREDPAGEEAAGREVPGAAAYPLQSPITRCARGHVISMEIGYERWLRAWLSFG